MLRSAWEALAAHPRAAWGLALFVLLVLAFAAGRASAPPPRVEVRTQEVVKWRERTVEVEKQVEVRVAAEERVRTVYRDRVVKPDGTVHEREVAREESATRSSTASAREAARDTAREGEARREERVTRAPERPPWRVGVLAGAALQAPGSPVVGPYVERRLFGPVSLGAWALVPAGPGAPVAGGLALTVGF